MEEVIAQETINEDSILEFYDNRRTKNSKTIVAWVMPRSKSQGGFRYVIYRKVVDGITGLPGIQEVSVFDDQLLAIRRVFGAFKNNQLGIELQMEIVDDPIIQ